MPIPICSSLSSIHRRPLSSSQSRTPPLTAITTISHYPTLSPSVIPHPHTPPPSPPSAISAISVSLARVLAGVLDSFLVRYLRLYGSDARVFSSLGELGVELMPEPGFHQVFDCIGKLWRTDPQ